MKPAPVLLSLLATAALLPAEIRVPASTAYGSPDFDALRIRREGLITRWSDPAQAILWFGQVKSPGGLEASVAVTLPQGATSQLTLTIGDQAQEFTVTGTGAEQVVKAGTFAVKQAGYVKFALTSRNAAGAPAGDIGALVLDGPATEGAHFNLDPRRNAASVHLAYRTPDKAQITAFYTEVTAVEDPVYTYYMACGFSRGYFGMQVNNPAERRIIFSVWDAAEGGDAKDRSTVSEENHTKLLAKGDDVHASVFGNEGTGGHSHLKYMWKTGEVQKFVVTAKAEGTNTDYSGYWFHPEEQKWTLLASFRAPKDGKHLRGLYSFSENFGGSNGHLQRKARYGNQWIRTTDGKWSELLTASFSFDGTGKANRLDRFMGVEDGQFFLSQGGFVDGFTKYGEPFTRPSTGKAPVLVLPE